MIRSVVAVVSGFVGWVLLTAALWKAFGYEVDEVPGTGFLLFSLCCEVVFALACGYLTALIARNRPGLHGAWLAAAMAVQGGASLVIDGHEWPLWVPLSTILVLAPCCWLGGRLRAAHCRRVDHGSQEHPEESE